MTLRLVAKPLAGLKRAILSTGTGGCGAQSATELSDKTEVDVAGAKVVGYDDHWQLAGSGAQRSAAQSQPGTRGWWSTPSDLTPLSTLGRTCREELLGGGGGGEWTLRSPDVKVYRRLEMGRGTDVELVDVEAQRVAALERRRAGNREAGEQDDWEGGVALFHFWLEGAPGVSGLPRVGVCTQRRAAPPQHQTPVHPYP